MYTIHVCVYICRKEVIQKSVGIDPEHVGAPLWKLALCLLLSWIVVVCCLIKGVKSSGKVIITSEILSFFIIMFTVELQWLEH